MKGWSFFWVLRSLALSDGRGFEGFEERGGRGVGRSARGRFESVELDLEIEGAQKHRRAKGLERLEDRVSVLLFVFVVGAGGQARSGAGTGTGQGGAGSSTNPDRRLSPLCIALYQSGPAPGIDPQ